MTIYSECQSAGLTKVAAATLYRKGVRIHIVGGQLQDPERGVPSDSNKNEFMCVVFDYGSASQSDCDYSDYNSTIYANIDPLLRSGQLRATFSQTSFDGGWEGLPIHNPWYFDFRDLTLNLTFSPQGSLDIASDPDASVDIAPLYQLAWTSATPAVLSTNATASGRLQFGLMFGDQRATNSHPFNGVMQLGLSGSADVCAEPACIPPCLDPSCGLPPTPRGSPLSKH
ncbi:MAG: hypothetical protein ACYDCC_03555 [Actinomycetota bacterium]